MGADWRDFFVATAGAAAALAGLIIVAISVNIKDIVTLPSVTSRAAATVATLVLGLVATTALLIPVESLRWPGLAILLSGIVVAVLVVKSASAMLRDRGRRPLAGILTNIVIAAVQVLPFLVGSLLLVSGSDDGVAWVAVGVLLVFVGSVLNAWVLLVEILR